MKMILQAKQRMGPQLTQARNGGNGLLAQRCEQAILNVYVNQGDSQS